MKALTRFASFTLPLALSAGAASAQTTELSFNLPGGYLDLVSGYGDRVNGAMVGPWTYTGTGSFTPNVLASFGCQENGLSYYVYPWSSGYNGLTFVVYPPLGGVPGAGGEMVVTLTADPGYVASLHSFDIGNWGAAIDLPYVRVENERGTVLYEDLNAPLAASTSPNARHYALSPAPTGRILTLRISVDGLGGNADNVGLDNLHFGQQTATPTDIGTPYCSSAANSSGGPGALRAWGSTSLAANDIQLVATGLPFNAFGFFLASRNQGFVMNPAGSQGNICLGSGIGRYVGPGQVQSSGYSGNLILVLDLAAMPTPAGLVPAQAGQTWNFQAWHRDMNPALTSNFTSGVSILLQ